MGQKCERCNGLLIQRADDANIQKRLEEYAQETMFVIEHFNNDTIASLNINVTESSSRVDVRDEAVGFFGKHFGL